jgi:hypothetical protein
MAAVMTAETGNVVGHGHPISDLKLAHVASDFEHLAGDFVTQNRRFFQLLETDLVDVRETDTASVNL